MKVLLRSDIDGVGKRGDIVDVAGGFARNYLSRRGRPSSPRPGSRPRPRPCDASRDLRDARDHESSETVARTLVGNAITMSARATGERLFGSVPPPTSCAGRGADRCGDRPQGSGPRRAHQDGGRAQRAGRAAGRRGVRADRRGRREAAPERLDRPATRRRTASGPAARGGIHPVVTPHRDDGGMPRCPQSFPCLSTGRPHPRHGHFPNEEALTLHRSSRRGLRNHGSNPRRHETPPPPVPRWEATGARPVGSPPTTSRPRSPCSGPCCCRATPSPRPWRSASPRTSTSRPTGTSSRPSPPCTARGSRPTG